MLNNWNNVDGVALDWENMIPGLIPYYTKAINEAYTERHQWIHWRPEQSYPLNSASIRPLANVAPYSAIAPLGDWIFRSVGNDFSSNQEVGAVTRMNTYDWYNTFGSGWNIWSPTKDETTYSGHGTPSPMGYIHEAQWGSSVNDALGKLGLELFNFTNRRSTDWLLPPMGVLYRIYRALDEFNKSISFCSPYQVRSMANIKYENFYGDGDPYIKLTWPIDGNFTMPATLDIKTYLETYPNLTLITTGTYTSPAIITRTGHPREYWLPIIRVDVSQLFNYDTLKI